MAAIDYGTIIFKNGKRYHSEDMFPVIEELGNINFYKYWLEKYVDGKSQTVYSMGWDGKKKSVHFVFEGNRYWIKQYCDRVYYCEIHAGCDTYQVVFGYGIEGDKKIWDDIKVAYLGKKRAARVDRLLHRFTDWR